ncbi:family 1 glycosylhydrolase [Bacillus sp. SL00103]
MILNSFVNLYHFDMPMALQEKRRVNRQVVDDYVSYAELCFQLFGDRVKKWFTHNEPIVPVEGGYMYSLHIQTKSISKKAVQVGYHELLSNAKAIAAYKKLKQDGKIGIILNLTPILSEKPESARREAK